MSKELLCTAHERIELRDYEDPPVLAPGQIRIRNTHGAEKHGTMMSFYKGYGNQRGAFDAAKQMHVAAGVVWAYPIGLGNMNVGIVEDVGSGVATLRAGDRVLYGCHFRPTAVRRESDVWKLPAEVSWKSAVCLDPLMFALAAVRDGGVRVGDAVSVFGLGAIGLMAVQLAKLAGACPVIAIDPLPNRRAVAAKTGADLAIDPTGCDVGARLREETAWRGVDVIIEYSGALDALQAALRGVAFGGTVVAGAFPGPMRAGLDLGAEAHMNRPNLVFSRACSDPNRDHPRWNEARIAQACLKLIIDGRIEAEDVVAPVVPFDDDVVAAYLKIASSPGENVKLGIRY